MTRDLVGRWRTLAEQLEPYAPAAAEAWRRAATELETELPDEGDQAVDHHDTRHNAGVDMTVEQLATRFGRKPSTIRTWCERGELPGCYRNHGREWRIPTTAIAAMQRAQSEPKSARPKSSRTGASTDLGEWRRHVRGSAS
jgi:hypothetical protein